MYNIFVFSQHLKIESLSKFLDLSKNENTNLFITTHYLFDNERKFLLKTFEKCEFKTFADFLEDEEMANCDLNGYLSPQIDYSLYLYRIKSEKNKIVIKKIIRQYPSNNKYILSNDLGICLPEWKNYGFKFLKGEYYYETDSIIDNRLNVRNFISGFPFFIKAYNFLRSNKQSPVLLKPEDVSVSFFKGKKYVFIGRLSRLGYRLNISFIPSEEEADKLNAGIFESKDECTYLTTWHEHSKCQIPDKDCYDVRWAQDGYLPPNYTHKDYFFKPQNVIYYCWDILGTYLFKNQGLPYELIPFRKKLYLPKPVFPDKIRNILIVASGSGDWTALKNRSDDDIMVNAFVQIAKKFPNIHFTYRCHPTWIHPSNVGVNAVNRVNDYFQYLGLPNLTLSSNIPIAKNKEGYLFSFSRNSLDEDLKKSDFVFGEHSISMIDAAFKGIPFCSVNLTNRRNFFVGINDLGFPKCESIEQIESIIEKITDKDFCDNYLKAIEKYNSMTDIDK